MPKLIDGNVSDNVLVSTESGAHNYRFVGLEAATTYTGSSPPFYAIFQFGNNESPASLLPHDLILDRMYIHGNAIGSLRRCVFDGAVSVAVVDSYLADAHEDGSDSQAILILNSPGPAKIVNNYLEGAGENIMLGGTPNVTYVPADIEIRHNHIYKPLVWQGAWNGVTQTFHGAWTVKNLMEIKNGQRVLIDGNVLENNWPAGQSNPVIWNGIDGSTSVIEDITFTNNLITNVTGGFVATANSYSRQLRNTNSLLYRNNVIEEANAVWSYDIPFRIYAGVRNVTVDHNTVVSAQQQQALLFAGDPVSPNDIDGPILNFVFTNNLGLSGNYGAMNLNISNSPYGTTTQISGNLIVNPSQYYGPEYYTNYPGNYFPADFLALNFVNFNNAYGGDYHFAPFSAYKGRATDGKDPGADIDALNSAIAGVVVGGTSIGGERGR